MRYSLCLMLILVIGTLGQAAEITDLMAPAPPPVAESLSIMSPAAYADLSGQREVHIAWQSALAGEITYSVAYSSDGKKFTEPIADKLTSPECVWNPKASRDLFGWVKVKANDTSGVTLAERTVPVSFIPRTAVVVSKANQKVYHFSDGVLKSVFVCSTALPKYDLDAGQYRVYLRETRHWSRKWEVWMPHALFFHEGYALHATTCIRQLGRAASHGCVRLHPRDAKTLFGEIKVGTPVIVLPKSRDCSRISAFYDRKPTPLTEKVVVAVDKQN